MSELLEKLSALKKDVDGIAMRRTAIKEHERPALFDKFTQIEGLASSCEKSAIDQSFSRFKIGDQIRKISGYAFVGTVRSVFQTTKGEVRIVAELNDNGMLHIFNEKQLEIISEEEHSRSSISEPENNSTSLGCARCEGGSSRKESVSEHMGKISGSFPANGLENWCNLARKIAKGLGSAQNGVKGVDIERPEGYIFIENGVLKYQHGSEVIELPIRFGDNKSESVEGQELKAEEGETEALLDENIDCFLIDLQTRFNLGRNYTDRDLDLFQFLIERRDKAQPQEIRIQGIKID